MHQRRDGKKSTDRAHILYGDKDIVLFTSVVKRVWTSEKTAEFQAAKPL